MSKKPLYKKIEEYLMTNIENGSFKENHKIPSETTLCSEFNTSRMTVRQAINNLVYEGYLYRQKGKGTFVNTGKFEKGKSGLKSFSEEMIERGYKPSNEIVHFEIAKADETIASQLRIDPGEKIYIVERIRLADDIHLVHQILYRPYKYTPNLTKKDFLGSTYVQLSNFNIHVTYSKQVIGARLCDKKTANLLKININDQLLYINAISYTANNVPIQLTKSYYRADKYEFIYTIKRETDD